jgi:hypothetical protein
MNKNSQRARRTSMPTDHLVRLCERSMEEAGVSTSFILGRPSRLLQD